MKVKLGWLNELVDISDISEQELIKTLSLYSIEVEGNYKVLNGTNLVIGHVLSVERVKDSDHLSACRVDVGDEILPIVCGAPNVRAGQYVIVAKVGAELPGGFKIKKAKIRGEESRGMICSLEELGLEKKYIPEEYQNGIFYFKEEVAVGSDPLKALNFDDTVIELGVTPNRGDLLSMLGVAIEVSAVYDRPFRMPSFDVTYSNEECKDYIEVTSETAGCAGYYAQIFKNVTIKPSPWWLVSRLIAFGIRPINNVVDITNYILALFGQPLHAFDYDKLGNRIAVRNARLGETIVTLDGEERRLVPEDLLITDGERPVALAGVMGGLDTEIVPTTKNIVLEAAVFDPMSVSKTSRRLGLISESSMRFEKGVDINRTKIAVDYAAYLFQTLAGAEVLKEPVFVGADKPEPVRIAINADETNKLLGTSITDSEIKDICRRLKFSVNGDYITIPSRRPDIKIKEDLIEEIGRIHGYDKMPSTIPVSPSFGHLTDKQKTRREIKDILTGLGFNQLITYSLTGDENAGLFSSFIPDKGQTIELINPITSARKFLRTSLLPGLIENARYCYAHKIRDLAVYELGKVYYKTDKYYEPEHLALLMTGQFAATPWRKTAEQSDFYLLKGICDTLFSKLGFDVEYRPIEETFVELHPHRSASLYAEGKLIGLIGALHPQFAAENDLDDVYVCELDISAVLERQRTPVVYQQFHKFPSVERDIAVIVGSDVLAGSLINAVKQSGNKYLREVDIFDVYSGENVGSDKKSVGIKLVFSADYVLTDEEINRMVDKIVRNLESNHQAKLRDE